MQASVAGFFGRDRLGGTADRLPLCSCPLQEHIVTKGLPRPQGRNTLLHSLPDDDRALITPHLHPVELALGMVLEAPGEPVDTVYFPDTGVGSILAIGKRGDAVEAGLFGREGMSGYAVILGGGSTPNKAVVQVAGQGSMIAAGNLRAALDKSPGLRNHLLLYLQSLLIQVSQTALSNGKAKLEERLARWLLMCHDRIDGDRMALTHEFLSVMLGVRRAGVTVGTHLLEDKGLIRARRGEITVLDRAGLEADSSESYGVAEQEYTRLMAMA